MYYHLISDDTMQLNDIGIIIQKKYPNIRFLFEIDFTKDDYLYIKESFLKESTLSKDNIVNGYFKRYFSNDRLQYFSNYSLHRIPFLLLISGFIRYEYLNSENPSNFFSNFVKNILKNDATSPSNFRQELIDYFFKWRGNKIFAKEGLYIYETQTQGVSLKLDDAGYHQYLNSLILHSGGISEKDLQEYLKIIKSISKRIEGDDISMDMLYLITPEYTIYSNRLKNFFSLLSLKNEVSEFVHQIIHKSIICVDETILAEDPDKLFELPLYLKNYLRFTGKYGEELESYSVDLSYLVFEKGAFYFLPKFIEQFTDIDDIAFMINDELFELDQMDGEYSEESFSRQRFLIKEPDCPLSIDLSIDQELFERYRIDIFNNDFVLLNFDFSVRKMSLDVINITMKDEREGEMYIVSSEEIKLPVQDEYTIQDKKVFLYRMMINRLRKSFKVNDRNIKLYFIPTILSEYIYQDDEGYEYYDELPRFDIHDSRDMEKFKAKDLLDDTDLDYTEYCAYTKDIGKFKIELLNRIYSVVYIRGFEIIQWPEWYSVEKSAQIFIASKQIDSNCDEHEEQRDGILFTYELDEDCKEIWFKIDDKRYVDFKIKKPVIAVDLIDSKGKRTKVKNKNINIERLGFFKSINVKLLNYPSNINFNSLQINDKYISVQKINNEYTVPVKDILAQCDDDVSHYLVKLRQNILYQNLFHLVRVSDAERADKSLTKQGLKEIVKVQSLDFIKENMGDVKYYILINNDRKPFFVSRITTEDISGFIMDLVEFHEVRKTNKNTIIKKPFKTILNDGVYVEAEAII